MWQSRRPTNHYSIVPMKVPMNFLQCVTFVPLEIIIWALNAVRWPLLVNSRCCHYLLKNARFPWVVVWWDCHSLLVVGPYLVFLITPKSLSTTTGGTWFNRVPWWAPKCSRRMTWSLVDFEDKLWLRLSPLEFALPFVTLEHNSVETEGALLVGCTPTIKSVHDL